MQNTFNCAIPIFWSIIKNLWIFPNFQVFFKFILGAVSCGAQDGIPPWEPQLTAPKKNSTLGAATYGAQGKFEKKTWKLGKIQSFVIMLKKIGIAQLNVFCTALHVLAYASPDPLKIWSWAYRPMTQTFAFLVSKLSKNCKNCRKNVWKLCYFDIYFLEGLYLPIKVTLSLQ